MINIDSIFRSVSGDVEDGLGDDGCDLTNNGLLELIIRLREAEKDAARYRWLRESASTESHGGLTYDFRLVDAIRYIPGAVPNETMDIDEAIDEAMQCK